MTDQSLSVLAPNEPFFASFKLEMHLRGDPFESQAEAHRTVFKYIEIFYNRQPRHAALNNLTPTEYEKKNILNQSTWRSRDVTQIPV